LLQLKNGALTVDELSDRTGFDARSLITRLAQLEMDGLVTALPGRKYLRT
jgi:predicted Rossmann fold nucleotide-binding protein DprA/Smf involved in DNA uptake